jgi:hypothetical protein
MAVERRLITGGVFRASGAGNRRDAGPTEGTGLETATGFPAIAFDSAEDAV